MGRMSYSKKGLSDCGVKWSRKIYAEFSRSLMLFVGGCCMEVKGCFGGL